jgi:monoamine oxidase
VNAAKYDVLVIGAGAAGLTAGRLLADAGRHVAILEARNRVGGRIWTRKVASEGVQGAIPVELGAEFIHGLPRVTWALVREAALATYELGGSQLWFADRQLAARSDQQSDSRLVLEDMREWVTTHDLDMSFGEYLKMSVPDASMRESAASYVEGFNAADQNRIGIAALAEQQRAEDAINADRIFRVEDGYEAIPSFLSEQFVRAGGQLFLGTTAHRVAWKRGGVVVSVRDRAGASSNVHADRAVITVPLGVLQAESIDFTPRPAEVLLQANRLAMGAAVRVMLIFRSRFWCERPRASKRRGIERELADLSFLFTPAELPTTWWTPMPRDIPMLTAWAGGPRAAALQRMITPDGDQHALLNRCLATLSKVFDLPLADLKTLLVSWHTHDWQNDEHALGAYSYVPAGALDAPERMGRPVEDTLYFAGEHTDTSGHWGTVHAALATGARAAHQVLSSA